MDREQSARLHGLGAVLLWSTVATAFKLSLRHLEPVQLLFWSTVVALLILGLMVARSGVWSQLSGAGTREWVGAASLGLLNPFLYYTILFESYDRLPAQIAQPLNFTWAIMLSLLAVPLLGQRLRRGDIAALVVSYSGVVVLCTGGRWTGLDYDPLGITLGLISTVIWALYWIYNTRNRLDPVLSLFLGFLVALPAIALLALLTTGITTGGWRGLAGAAYVGAVEMGFAFVLWLRALKLSRNTSRIANLIFLAPFLSLLAISLVLGERIRASTGVALVLIVVGQWLQRGPESAPPAETAASAGGGDS